MKKLNLRDFSEKEPSKRADMKRELQNNKLEKVLSLWYLYKAESKATFIGSKN